MRAFALVAYELYIYSFTHPNKIRIYYYFITTFLRARIKSNWLIEHNAVHVRTPQIIFFSFCLSSSFHNRFCIERKRKNKAICNGNQREQLGATRSMDEQGKKEKKIISSFLLWIIVFFLCLNSFTYVCAKPEQTTCGNRTVR